MTVAAHPQGGLGAARRPARDLLHRIEGEYREMPGLRLTAEQAQRLWGLDRETCSHVLGDLVDRKFLICGTDHQYRRATDDAVRQGRR